MINEMVSQSIPLRGKRKRLEHATIIDASDGKLEPLPTQSSSHARSLTARPRKPYRTPALAPISAPYLLLNMGKMLTHLTPQLIEFIGRQKIFFTATAPRDGRINLSPKGHDAFRILSSNRVGYLDLTGSGNETSAHLLADGRLTFMFCAFDGPPLILRLYGRGETIAPTHPDWPQLRPLFGPPLAGERHLIVAHIESIQTSCGMAVPLYAHTADRHELLDWAEKKGPAGVAAYRAEKNTRSIDGLPTPLAAQL